MPAPARKIVVVDLGFLGDTIHLVPALWELRRHHSGARLDVVTTPVGAEVLRLVRCVDRVWEYPLSDPSPPWWRHLGLQWRLARERYDLAVNFSGADRTLFVTAFAGIGRRVTRAGKRYRFWQRWLAGQVVPAPPRNQPVYEQRRAMLSGAGYALAAPRFEFEVPKEAAAWAAVRVPEGAIHLSINASSPFKEWPVPRWAELTRLLLARDGGAVVATGSAKARERERLVELAAAVKDARLRVIEESPSIPQLAAIVARARVHVGTDSGVTHLAMALGRPTVSVFRDYAGLEEWRPRGEGHTALTAVCVCVDRPRMQPECETAGMARCLAGIRAEAVAERVPRPGPGGSGG